MSAVAGVLLSVGQIDRGTASSRVATVPVVIAATDIGDGQFIDRASLVVAMWPAGTQPAGAYTTIDSVVGRVPRVTIFKGEALVPGRLAPAGTGAGLGVRITPGKRAYAIRINDVSGIAGMVQPNSRVDVLVVVSGAVDSGKGKVDSGKRRKVARLFMSNIRVLAIGPIVQRASDGRPSDSHVVTLEVRPEEVEKLAIAASLGSISLVLRGYGDPDSITTNGLTAADVVTILRAAPEYEAPVSLRVTHRPDLRSDTAQVTIVRGTRVETAKFRTDDSTTSRRPDRRF